ncbi:WD40 repeat-containing protein [Leptolyngbyaceae cyanobacterium JSC-12]|nr:WD40 repeat-containing protein [Leptolyngbyaceae cyanobacterium JSC-12]
MTYCLNPDCPKPRNPDSAKTCRSCGAKLLLKDRYRAIATIGQGGFGRTFLAVDEDKPSKPRCVIKQFLPVAQNPRNLKKALSLFEQEAVRLEELGHHPQIPELLAYFNQEGNQYLIQEFIHGKNLADALAEQGVFWETQVREVLAKLLPVLDFVHSHNVIHRDIKPGNVIITGSQLGMSLPRSGQLDWALLQQALAIESNQGFRNFVSPSYRFNELLGFSLSQPSKDLPTAFYTRCQQLAVQCMRYPTLPIAQRQYIVADASRLLYEIQQLHETRSGTLSIGRLVLVDFGAAKSLKGLAAMQTGTTIGSPEYVAPEQARGKAVFASDLYSLGVTCVHLLTKISPYDLFDPATDTWVWRKYLTAPISEQLSSILDRLLERAIARRYQSAAEVLQDLEGSSIAPIPPSVPIPPLPLQPAKLPQPTNQSALQFPVTASQPLVQPSLQPSFRIARRPRVGMPAIPKVPTLQLEEPEPEVKSRRRSQPNWRCVQTFESPARIYALALSPTEPILASTSGNTIKLWDIEQLKPIRTLTGHLDIIPAIAITPDGKHLLSGSADKTIGIWELSTGRQLSKLALHSDTVLALALSSDGQTLASSSFYDPITLWDLEAGYKRYGLMGHSARIDALAFRPSLGKEKLGEMLASGSSDLTIKLWDVDRGEELRTLEGHTHHISALAFNSDGTTLASASWDGTVKLWNLKSRRHRTLEVESGRINGIAFSLDGKKLAIASDTLQLWTVPSGKKITLAPGHTDPVCAVLFGRTDQMLISAGFDRTIKLWQWE